MNKIILSVLVCLIAVGAWAGITGQTAITVAVSAASTNNGAAYSSGESHKFNPQTFFIDHTNLVTATNALMAFQVSFDGGATWATVTNWTTASTNATSETWNPFGGAGLTVNVSNRVVVTTQTNVSATVKAVWNQ